MGIRDWLPFLRRGGEDAQEAEALRARFEVRYHHFKLLLTANNETHESIAEIEQALRGDRPYGMHFVRAICTRTSASVFQIIHNLQELAPGQYEPLHPRFTEIQRSIQEHLSAELGAGGGGLVLRLEELGPEHVSQVGPKMARLGRARSELGVPVPAGFVITAEAFQRFLAAGGLQEEIDRRIQAGKPGDQPSLRETADDVVRLIEQAPLPPELEGAILAGVDAVEEQSGTPLGFAIRSSALSEDLRGATFAGQYRTVLNVRRDGILAAYRQVVASKYSPQAMAYRMRRGDRDEDVAMCVGCMGMIDSACGGVAYSRNPVDRRDGCVAIHAALGLPGGVVDGSSASDVYAVTRQRPRQVRRREIADKAEKLVSRRDSGTRAVAVPESERSDPCLTEAQAVEVARLAMILEEHFSAPQDVEWTLDGDGRLVLLQCRPIPRIGTRRREEGEEPATEALPPLLARGGHTASPGTASGPVFAVRRDADANRLPDGAVLVLEQPLPRRALLLDRAVAVIAERGGAAGHLASVAREYGVPALFGVRGVTGLLHEGQMVTVDADGLAVYEGRAQALLAAERPQERPMAGSPVEAVLDGAARYILPLNLIDPDAPEFKARNCSTYHDLMRYCHEKAVQEMFAYSERQRFPQRAARQLVCEVRRQFWVLDLDDGFSGDGRERDDGFVSLEQIRSVPMLALWTGMMAIPWEGPPPINPRGLLSVMFEATANPALNPAAQSPYTMKNYFMIARHFCSLQSRFGFHFCGAEALVGQRRVENYAAFQFKGGAASQDRRIRRARFIGEILEDQGFRVRIREDALTARLEGFEQAFMEQRLRALGYLIIHTRQLDMIMGDRAATAARREKIEADLAVLAETGGETAVDPG